MDKLNWRYITSCNFIAIFCYRRLILVLLVAFLPGKPYA